MDTSAPLVIEHDRFINGARDIDAVEKHAVEELITEANSDVMLPET